MFDIGFWELLIIAVVLMLVMGPERLPEVAKQAAFLLRKARQGMYRLRSEMQSELDQTGLADLDGARQEMASFKNDMRQMGRDLADAHEETVAPKNNASVTTQSESELSDEPAMVASNGHVANKQTATSSTPKNVAKKAAVKKGSTKKKTTRKVSKKASKKKANKTQTSSVKKAPKPSEPTMNKSRQGEQDEH